MTNVPDKIRQIWTDLYKLFDLHFKMDIHSEADWKSYWEDGQKIWENSGRNEAILALINDTADYIVSCIGNG